MQTDLQTYRWMEARAALRTQHLLALPLGLLLGVLSSFLMPAMPPMVLKVFGTMFQAKTWTDSILLNDYLAFFVILYWLGIFDLLRIYIVPAEERYLDVLLSKPLTRTQYLMARVWPTFAVLLALGVLLVVGYWVKIALINGLSELNTLAYFSASAIVVSFTLFVLSIVMFAFMFFDETYNALVVACAACILPLLPASMYMYRPDVFTSAVLKYTVVFPANLLWSPSSNLLWACVLAPAFLGGAYLFILLTGKRLESMDSI